jgi:hypothetical protein
MSGAAAPGVGREPSEREICLRLPPRAHATASKANTKPVQTVQPGHAILAPLTFGRLKVALLRRPKGGFFASSAAAAEVLRLEGHNATS